MAGKRGRDGPASRMGDQDHNTPWAVQAQNTFQLLPVEKAATELEQQSWQQYFAVRTKSTAEWRAGVQDDSIGFGYEMRPHLMRNVTKLLASFERLTQQERELLQSCVVMGRASADYTDGGHEVRGYEAVARMYSVDSNSAVDIYHSHHHRTRWKSIEHFAEVSAAIRSPVDERLLMPSHSNRAGYSKLWSVTLRDTGTREFVYAEDRHFHLTASKIKAFREALFTGPQGKALGDKLDDYELMQLLLTPVGVDEADLGLPSEGLGCDVEMRSTCDGWEGVNLRRVCGAATEDDADWEELNFEEDIQRQRDFEAEDEDSDGGGDLLVRRSRPFGW